MRYQCLVLDHDDTVVNSTALEVDDAVLLAVAAALMADGDAAIAVAAGGL